MLTSVALNISTTQGAMPSLQTTTFGAWVAEIEKRCHLLLPAHLENDDAR